MKNRQNLASFDSLYQILTSLFDSLEDKRARNTTYKLSDALKSGFAVFSLKCASLFSFRKRNAVEDNNIQQIYGISDIPSDNTLRSMLDKVSPAVLRKGFNALFKRLQELEVLEYYQYWQNHFVVSVDGVEHFCSKKVSCPNCLSRTHRDGSTSFFHSMLSAVIVHPEEKEVFVLDNEPIVKQDGATKNDCERNAIKRLLTHLKTLYSGELMVFVFDALYACSPVIRQFSDNKNWKYVIAIKPKGNKHLFNQFANADIHGLVNWHTKSDKEGKHRFGYINDVALNKTAPEIRVNMLHYEWTNKKGETKQFSWITCIELTKFNIDKVMRMGRSRWKIENETFNTLKNQEYHYEHNFGHGQEHLTTVFAYLMMLAFTVDQIQQQSCRDFKRILTELKTRVKFWEVIRSVVKLVPCINMQKVYVNIAEIYQVRLL